MLKIYKFPSKISPSRVQIAIQFVITNKYSGKTKQERDSLQYKGLNNEKLEIDVSLVFDNSSRGLPIDKDEVSI